MFIIIIVTVGMTRRNKKKMAWLNAEAEVRLAGIIHIERSINERVVNDDDEEEEEDEAYLSFSYSLFFFS